MFGLIVHACGSGARVVTNLTTRMEKEYYIVVLDNFFTNSMLFNDLLKYNFYSVGKIA